MILFCEDCGKKNHLDETKINNGKAVFRCKFCNYFNQYQVETAGTNSLKQTAHFLKKLKKQPEIIGSFIYGDNKIVGNSMPDDLKQSDLVTIGKNLTNCFSLCQSFYKDVVDMTLTLSDKTIVVKRVEENYTLILVTKKAPLPEKNETGQTRQIVNLPGID